MPHLGNRRFSSSDPLKGPSVHEASGLIEQCRSVIGGTEKDDCSPILTLTKRQPSIMPYYSELELSPHDVKPVTIQCLLTTL